MCIITESVENTTEHRKIDCILCRQLIPMTELSPSQYINHLVVSHKFEFDVEYLVKSTLLLQYIELIQPEPCDCEEKENA